MISNVLIGTTITLTAEFRNELDVKFAPVTVNLKYKKPLAPTVTTVPVTADINNNYVNGVLMDTVGVWHFRWESTSGNTVAKEFDVTVTDTKVK